VFDLYVDGKWMISKGGSESILNELRIIMDEVESYAKEN
jgi:hypothetical protein